MYSKYSSDATGKEAAEAANLDALSSIPKVA